MINLEYWKAYLRTMPEAQFNLIISLISAFVGITLVLIEPTYYIVTVLISVVIQLYTYWKRNKDNG